MPTMVIDDPLGIKCVFSDGSRADFDLQGSPNPRLVRDLAAGLVELIYPHGSVDADLRPWGGATASAIAEMRSGREGRPRPIRRSRNSPTSELKPWPGSPPNTTRSSGSARPPHRRRTSPASRRPDRRSSDHADAIQRSDVSHRHLGLIATPSATGVANFAPGNVQFKRNTNPTAHGHCGEKSHGGDADG
jgi:hypothetical protein